MTLERDHHHPVVLGSICGACFLAFGLTEAIIGFISIGQCTASEELPEYTGIHGLLNMGYGLGLMMFVTFGYYQFVFRLVFYSAWIVEGVLCIGVLVLYLKTKGFLKECSAGCSTCEQRLLTGILVVESVISTLYILITLSIIGYELQSRCERCKINNRVDPMD